LAGGALAARQITASAPGGQQQQGQHAHTMGPGKDGEGGQRRRDVERQVTGLAGLAGSGPGQQGGRRDDIGDGGVAEDFAPVQRRIRLGGGQADQEPQGEQQLQQAEDRPQYGTTMEEV
jgi:hypothetical protein